MHCFKTQVNIGDLRGHLKRFDIKQPCFLAPTNSLNERELNEIK